MGNPFRSEDGFMKDYNYHDWVKFMVRDEQTKPKGQHFAAVLLGTRTEHSPGYDRDDVMTSSTVPETTYFAFPDKNTLSAWVLRAHKKDMSFFFFEVKSIGNAVVKVDLDIKDL